MRRWFLPGLLLLTTAPVWAQPSGHSYQVRKGEALDEIARAHGVSVQQLMRTNGISDPNRVFAGEFLRLPPGARAAAPAPKPAKPKVTPAARPAQTTVGAKPTVATPPASAKPAAKVAPTRVARTAPAAKPPASTALPPEPASHAPVPAAGSHVPTKPVVPAAAPKPPTKKLLFGIPDETAKAQPPRSLWAVGLDLVWKLALVLGLAYGSLILLKRFSGSRAFGTLGGSSIRHLESLSLGPNRSLHLVRIGGRVLLLGSSSTQISFLAEVEESDLGRAAGQPDMPASFPGLLDRFLKHQDGNAAPEGSGLSSILGDTARHLKGRSQDLRGDGGQSA
ncbi:MAG TPA: flagellar biosynthetic protein FliO [Armatimonadota bacterium]|jgi:flagellar biosynthetic protein FliO